MYTRPSSTYYIQQKGKFRKRGTKEDSNETGWYPNSDFPADILWNGTGFGVNVVERAHIHIFHAHMDFVVHQVSLRRERRRMRRERKHGMARPGKPPKNPTMLGELKFFMNSSSLCRSFLSSFVEETEMTYGKEKRRCQKSMKHEKK